jgi:acyl-CoA reductase-like NAD-dependent aldehyde dehydrogenase
MATVCPNLVGGKEVPSTSNNWTPVYNPSHAEVIAQAPVGTGEDVRRAVEAARGAWMILACAARPKQPPILSGLRKRFVARLRRPCTEQGEHL